MSSRDGGMKTAAGISAVVVNVLVFAGMAYAGIIGKKEAPEEPPAVHVDLVELPALGVERPKEALPRIVTPPPPPPPETDTASISREKLEEELEQQKKKEKEEEQRKLAEEKKRVEDEQRRKREEEQQAEKERKEREKKMARALKTVPDKRADEDNPDGFADGDRDGTSTSMNALAKDAYISRVSLVLTRQFQPPAVISRPELKKLTAHIALKVDAQGKLKGEPTLSKPSGNRFFDDAAIAAVKRFGPGTELKIPLPPDSDPVLRRAVLQGGITAIMEGARIN